MTVIRTRQQLYFAYGSNMDVAQMRSRVPGSRLLGAAYLSEHAFLFSGYSQTWGGAVANVTPKLRSRVFGVVYELPAGGLARLDGFEGYPAHYQRKQATVRFANGRGRFVAELYYKRVLAAAAPPSPEYVKTLLAAIKRHGG
jgi:gamma-glutamylcyclotransferase (GGCT)/AIG2-like uncharacterized protein YtfP